MARLIGEIHTSLVVGLLVFFALRVLQLVDEGKIDLEAPIARYTPEVFAGAPPQSALGRLGERKVAGAAGDENACSEDAP